MNPNRSHRREYTWRAALHITSPWATLALLALQIAAAITGNAPLRLVAAATLGAWVWAWITRATSAEAIATHAMERLYGTPEEIQEKD